MENPPAFFCDRRAAGKGRQKMAEKKTPETEAELTEVLRV